jgi:hypothetical protein
MTQTVVPISTYALSRRINRKPAVKHQKLHCTRVVCLVGFTLPASHPDEKNG